MKKTKFFSAAIAYILSFFSLFPNTSITSYAQESLYSAVETFTNGFMKVETGDIYEDVVKQINYGYDLEYDIYVQTDGKNVGMKSYAFVPINNLAEFVFSETTDIEEAKDACIPLLNKYNTFTFGFSVSEVKETEYLRIEKTAGYTDEEFAAEAEMLMEELKDTGYFYEYYPPGCLNNVTLISGNFEFLGEYQKKAVSEYINENLPNYSITDDGMLISDSNLTIQERFDVVQQIYDDIGVKTAFGTVHIGYDYVGNSIKLLEDTQPTVTTTVTTATETTTTTVSTTATTITTTVPTTTLAEATNSATVTTTVTTTIPAETTTTITTQSTEQAKPLGDANGDNELNVRDCAFIAAALAQGRNDELSETADFNGDGEVNVRDAAAVARKLAEM